MSILRAAGAVLALSGCSGEALDPEIAYGDIFFNGYATGALVRARLPEAARRTAGPLRIGVVPSHLLCRRYLGFIMDAAAETATTDASGGRQIVLRAAGGAHPACDVTEELAACGEPVSLVLVTDEDEVVARYATTYRCTLGLPAR